MKQDANDLSHFRAYFYNSKNANFSS